MVVGFLQALRQRITASTFRFGALCATLAVSVWGAYYYTDWFLFYVQRNHVVRDLDGYASALRQTGLSMGAAGTLQHDGAHIPL